MSRATSPPAIRVLTDIVGDREQRVGEPHLLVVMGSGETTPTMVTPHQRILAGFSATPRCVLLDTPYGFQENADELSTKTVQYFAHNVGAAVSVVGLRRPDEQTAMAVEAAQVAVADADWVFIGPGSPSYLLRQLAATDIGALLRERVGPQGHGVTVVSSAAAVTIGSHALPVYELYKAGHDPHWLDGLGLLGAIGLGAVLIPHFDNAEGGTHDTRYCYVGERRLAALESELPPGTWILGVDEHTAMTVDLGTGAVRVEGRGGVTVRRRDGSTVVFASGETTSLAELRAAGSGADIPDHDPGDAATAPPALNADAAPLDEAVDATVTAFAGAADERDATGATQAVLELEHTVRDWLADPTQGDGPDRAVARLRGLIVRLGSFAERGMVDQTDVVGPFVSLLVAARRAARDGGSYELADKLRDGLTSLGVELRDGPDGTTWTLQQPPT